MNFRIDRINSEIQKCIAEVIRWKIKDPRVTEMVSVLEVDTAKDLKTAKVYVSIYGDKEKANSTFEGLKLCAGFIRKELANDFKALRIVPQLNFVLDKSMEYSNKINALIEEIKHENN